MTKADIVEKIYEGLGITKKDISTVVDRVFEIMRDEILSKNNIKISGFGNFDVKTRGRRIGRNPKTGEEKVIEPRTVVVFRPSQLFKEEVNA
ncbi:integration host factor subunit alpha [Deferribacteraceae bacterium V6Fe1]|jgi:integration host factor subunit alpha|uniref:integration host factor subunit alpha n=1 Tax=Deferrivibrio essentukiensis TaxID=2880922 RepID=UPI001F60A826|nr:integration host factor subunit alpha [Deferrivibrio essentukiensis]MBZ4671953.1 histone family protein DNA-binding protein [Deferribacteraceae bacterium]MCB4204176.1 integration host factor subunit alpha [Deferrivibrio essentukiensis]UOD34356.1 integration host factor subunit alpha [Deferribacteraceae bacterium V6Fe1]